MNKNLKEESLILFITIMLFASLSVIGQVDNNYYKNQRKAFKASSTAECQSSLKFCIEALKMVPDHPVLNYLASRLNEQLGNSDIALKYLRKAAKLGYTSKARWLKINPINDPVLRSLRKRSEFKEIIQIMNSIDKPIHKSQIVFTVKDKELATEGITYDPAEKMFYLGSEFKIVKVDLLGNSINFTKNGKKDGLGSINGVHVDPIRRILWACSNDENRVYVSIFKYNLLSGEMIKKYTLPPDGRDHMFNDLALHPNGDVYITDTLGGAVFVIPSSTDSLKLFLKYKLFTGLNGITLAEKDSKVYTSSNVGIFKIDIKTKSVTLLTHEKNFHTYGIDGLYFSDNYLYAVQNELLTQVSRYSLNKDGTHIKSCEIFEKNTDDLQTPTTGVIVNDYIYFIADAHWNKSKHKGVVVMKVLIK